MVNDYKSYRIRTRVGSDSPDVINVHLEQTYDTFEILSLKIDSKNLYNLHQSDKGVVVGRVLANGGFGVPNAKVSIFIKSDEAMGIGAFNLYPYMTVNDTDKNQVRYNLLPDSTDDICHQDVGTFPNKRLVLDNNDVIEIFEEFWKYTTTTNDSGDYMLYGVPTGGQMLHMDVDLSDIGLLSVRPRDMIYKGYDINLFDSPNKFKKDTNLDSLSQLKTQNVGLYVYPFWGDTTENGNDIAITRCDINIDYKFEPTCIFMGSIITDSGNNAIGKNCAGTDGVGKMSDMVAGEGKIEMIRKTFDGKVEDFQIKGNRLIDGDGVWCYQIPMNLDYMMTDEFGNLVPTDNPDRGVPTRARVRFRISLDTTPSDRTATKRCMYLVPNNPRLDKDRYSEFVADKNHEVDYEFGTATRDEDYVDLLWNNVYTVKNYIPRIQKKAKPSNRMHTGIKLINHYGDNNPMPYNSLNIKLSFQYRFICLLSHVFIELIVFLNGIISLIGVLPCLLYTIFHSIANLFFNMSILGVCLGCPIGNVIEGFASIFRKIIPSCVSISEDFCGTDVTHAYTYYPGCGKFLGLDITSIVPFNFACVWPETKKRHAEEQRGKKPEDRTEATNVRAELFNCVESELAQDNDATSFLFANDWVNGVLYAPQWYRHIVPKRTYLFGLFKRRSRDEWCSSNHQYNDSVYLYQSCAASRNTTGDGYTNFAGKPVKPQFFGKNDKSTDCGFGCQGRYNQLGLKNGVILTKETMLGQTAYYYKAVEYDATQIQGKYDGLKLLFATDIVLLGSLNGCDLHGVPQFFRYLEGTTYKLPQNMLFTDNDVTLTLDKDGKVSPVVTQVSTSEMTGCDWGNSNDDICPKGESGGLFYSIGCTAIETSVKSCFNLSRVCEFGVSLDETKHIPDLSKLASGDETAYEVLVPDGFISKDELFADDERSMFATLNVNGLKTVLDERGMRVYDFRYLHLDNFDNSLASIMEASQRSCNKTPKHNYKLENFSKGYYDFRMGANPTFYPSSDANYSYSFPRYENSFYFYFGLKHGKTAIDKFSSQFFADCSDSDATVSPIGVISQPNSWCSEMDSKGNGYMAFNLSKIDKPCDVYITSMSDMSNQIILKNVDDDKIFISPTLETLEGYEKYADVEVIPATKNFGEVFLNGNYEISVVDSNGDTSVTTIDMRPEYLDFKVDEFDFEYSEADLSSIYFRGKTGDELYQAIGQRDITTKTEIGGYIDVLMDSIKCGGVGVGSYAISLTCDIKVDTNTYQSIKCEYSHKSGSTDESVTDDYTSVEKIGGNIVRFYLPKGAEIYKIDVTELCGDEYRLTNNKTTKSIKVSYPEPFKLYINDVIDYDVISDWNAGWKMNASNLDDNNGVVDDRSNFSDNWLHMSDITRYNWSKMISYSNKVEEIDELFAEYGISATVEDCLVGNGKIYGSKIFDGDWTAWADLSEKLGNCGFSDSAKEVVKKFYDELSPTGEQTAEEQKEACDVCLSLLNEIIASELEFMDMMKMSFQLTCENSSNVFSFSATGNKRPFTFHIFSREEEETSELYENTLAFEGMTYTNEGMSLEGDIMPTITSKDDIRYGTGDDGYAITGYGDLCFTRDNNSNKTNKHKYPYFIAVSDMHSPKATLPQGITVDNGTDEVPPKISGNVDEVFGFHVINKIFKFQSNLWGMINRMPVYMPFGLWGNKNEGENCPFDNEGVLHRVPDNKREWSESYAYNGAYLTLEGMLSGKILNGRATSYDGAGKHLTHFLQQVNGRDELTIYTFREADETDIDVEDKIPTSRCLIANGENPEWVDYYNGEKLADEYSNYLQYSPLRSVKDTYLNITDENGCVIGKQVSSGFSVVLDETSLNNRVNGDESKFSVSVPSGGSDVMYYAFPYVMHRDKNDDDIIGLRRYPLNHTSKEIGDSHCKYNMKIANDYNALKFDVNDNAYSLFSYKTFHDFFSTRKNNNIKTLMDTVWGGIGSPLVSTVDGVECTGYSDNGQFTFDRGINYAFFIVAVTSDGMKAISPVYDFIQLEGFACFVMLKQRMFLSSTDITTEGGDEYTIVNYEASETPSVGFGCMYHFSDVNNIVNWGRELKVINDFYYENYFSHTLSINVDLDGYGTISGAKNVVGYVDSGVTDLVEAIVECGDNVRSLAENGDHGILMNREAITLTDISGLNHRTRITRVGKGKKVKISITWSLNNDSAKWNNDNIPSVYTRTYAASEVDQKFSIGYNLSDYEAATGGVNYDSVEGKVFAGWSTNRNAASAKGFDIQTDLSGRYPKVEGVEEENKWWFVRKAAVGTMPDISSEQGETWYAIWI